MKHLASYHVAFERHVVQHLQQHAYAILSASQPIEIHTGGFMCTSHRLCLLSMSEGVKQENTRHNKHRKQMFQVSYIGLRV